MPDVMGDFTDKINKWLQESQFWTKKTNESYEKAQQLQQPLSGWKKFLSYLMRASTKGLQYTPSGEVYTGTIAAPELEQQKAVEEQLVFGEEAMLKKNRADFFSLFYQTAPAMIEMGETNFDKYMSNVYGNISEGTLSSEDIALARSEWEQMMSAKPAEGETPSWLEISPEEREAVEQFITEPLETRPKFKGIHLTTVEEMVRWLQKEVELPELPEGLTDADLLDAAYKSGLTEEQLAMAIEYDDMVTLVSQAWQDQQQQIDDVLAGRAEWEMPKLSAKQKLALVAMQPLQVIADIVKPYLKYYNYPLTGLIVSQIMHLAPYTPNGIILRKVHGDKTEDMAIHSYEKLYDEARATDNWWMAYSKAWEEWDINWGAKLALEVITDPLTYVGVGLVPKALKGIGAIPRLGKFGTAVTRLGRMTASFERGFNYVMGLPFDIIKGWMVRIPKTAGQTISYERGHFLSIAKTAIEGHSGAIFGKTTTREQIIEAIKFSIDYYRKHPDKATIGATDFYAEFGRLMTEITPLTVDDIARWTKQLDGKLLFSEVTSDIVDNINNFVYDVLIGRMSKEAGGKLILRELKAIDKPSALDKAVLLIGKHTNQFSARLKLLEKLETPQSILSAMVTQQGKIITSQVRSQYAMSRMQSGFTAGLRNWVAQKDTTIWRNIIDRYFVRPMAEAYLGFSAYPVWNAFEDMFRSIIEGVLPRQLTMDNFRLATWRINVGDLGLLTAGASDVQGMIRTVPGRENAVSFLPGKIPQSVKHIPIVGKHIAGKEFTEWLGRKWIDLSAIWGNAFRRNFVTRKSLEYFAARLENVAGRNVLRELNNIIRKPPSIRGLSSKSLKDEAFLRLSTGEPDLVRGMKKKVTSQTLDIDRQMDILHDAHELVPEARTWAENEIVTGRAMDDIDRYCEGLSRITTSSLHSHPHVVVDQFEYIAEKLANETITTPDEFMQAYQHLVIMEDTSGHVPHRLMSQTHEKAGELINAGKYGAMRKLWTGERNEMLEVMDRISISNQRIRKKLLDSLPSAQFTKEQEDAFRRILEHADIHDVLRSEALRKDGDILDAFWSLTKEERTAEAHQAVRLARKEVWDAYRSADAKYFGSDFLMRDSFAQLYYNLPKRTPLEVDTTGRAMVPLDAARILDCNVDELTNAITETLTFQDREYFVELLFQKANSNPSAYKGVTREKLSQLYDVVLDNIHMSPDMDIQLQKALMQIEEIKHNMTILKQTKQMYPDEEKALFSWIDGMADELEKLLYEKPQVVHVEAKPPTTFGLTVAENEKYLNAAKLAPTLEKAPAKKQFDVMYHVGSASHIDDVKSYGIRGQQRADLAAPFSGQKAVFLTQDKDYALDVIHKLDLEGKPAYITKIDVSGFDVWSEDPLARGAVSELEDVHSWFYVGDIPTNRIVELEEITAEGAIKTVKLPAKPPKLAPKAPARKFKPEFENWHEMRQEAWDEALKDYYKAYTDYTHQNVVDATMKHIFPYWTYESQRWFFLPRTFLRKPGVLTSWGKYNEYSEFGYVPIPGTDIQLNPARGSIFGLTFSLTRRDYPYYYSMLGPMAEPIDAMMRWGFYPGAHIMLPIVVSPIFTGRPPKLGESLPAFYKTGLNVLVGSPIPAVSENAQWLQDHVFSDNFRDYNIATRIDKLQVDAGGTLVDGLSGQELWQERFENMHLIGQGKYAIWGLSDERIRLMEMRIANGQLTPEEIDAWQKEKALAEEKDALWNEAAQYRAWLGVLMENISIFRYRPEVQVEALRRVTELIEAQTGLTAEQQDYLWKHNLKPSDVCPSIMSPSLRRAMNEMWEYKIWLGRNVILEPPALSDLDMKTNKFWRDVEGLQKVRTEEQTTADTGFLQPTPENHLNGREWVSKSSDVWNKYKTNFDSLKSMPEYAEVALTLEERIDQLRQKGVMPSASTPFDEILRIYYSIQPEVVKDKYTGEENIDWVGFYIKRETVRMALSEDQREEFDVYVRTNETPLEAKFRDVVNTYLKGYWAVRNIVLAQYTEAEKAAIAEYYADGTTLTRKKEIEDYVSPTTGLQLISGYQSQLTDGRAKLRMISPKLDFYLYVFGYVTTVKTDEARAMVDAWEQNRMSLLDGYV